jgi:hypothetical protein
LIERILKNVSCLSIERRTWRRYSAINSRRAATSRYRSKTGLANLPQSVLAGLEAAIFKAGRDAEVIAALGATGAQVSLPDSAEFARTLQRDVAHWVKVVTENPGSR